jgi:hypothetical protein
MLRTPPRSKDTEMAAILNLCGDGPPTPHPDLPDGYVVIGHWNPELVFNYVADRNSWPEFAGDQYVVKDRTDEWGDALVLSTHGVVDSIAQFEELFGDALRADPRHFFVSFVEIRRVTQPCSGGWRYHKWGAYYGTQNPQHEYIYHDKHITKVYTFKVVEMRWTV